MLGQGPGGDEAEWPTPGAGVLGRGPGEMRRLDDVGSLLDDGSYPIDISGDFTKQKGTEIYVRRSLDGMGATADADADALR